MTSQLYWGDSHLNLHSRDRERFEEAFRAARDHLDFLPIAYYPFEYYETKTGLRVESWRNRPQFLEEWKEINDLCHRYHEPGRFITFPGYEWHGNRTRWGDHNVYYFEEGRPLDDVEDIDWLYEHLRRHKGLAIPHHVGYATGQRAKDWSHHRPELTPFVELYSAHGCSETPVNRYPQPNYAMGPWTSGSTVMDALAAGCQMGIIASGDNHSGFAGVHGNGLMAVWAGELTREALWEAFTSRRVYGVTGDRIALDFSLDDAPMGAETTAAGPVRLRAHVECPQALDRVEWLRDNRVICTHCHLDTWEDDGADKVRCRLRVEPGWGPSTRYNYDPPEKVWHACVSISEGALAIVHGCWTTFGNSLRAVDDRTVEYESSTPRSSGRPTQAFILEATGPRSATLRIDCPPFDVRVTLQEALNRTHLWADLKGIRQLTQAQFGLAPEEIENADVFWHNAYKLRLLQAVPSAAFTTTLELTEPAPSPGRHWYYLRVHQVDGQTAWTSPVWVTST